MFLRAIFHLFYILLTRFKYQRVETLADAGANYVVSTVDADFNLRCTALTLEGAKANEVWDPEAKSTDDYQGGHKLIIKQALLGPDAKEGEVNVVQVEAMTWKESIKIPVAVLKGGSANNQVQLDLSFPDPPVTFTLIQGSGPVHLIGHHLIGGPVEEFDDMDEMEEEMIDDEEGDIKEVKTHFIINFSLKPILFIS